MKSVHIIVRGRVQGVFFRSNTASQASKLGIKGSVRNLDNGNVEIYAQGDDNAIEKFILWCHKGPQLARIDDVIIKPVKKQDFKDFSVL